MDKKLGRLDMKKIEDLDSLDPYKYGTQEVKAADIQALNTCLFYDHIRQKESPP